MPRRKDVGLSRRRVRDEDEAEIGDETGEGVDDSASEDSGFTDDEFDEDNESEETYSDDETAAAGQESTKSAGANGSATVAVVEHGRGDTDVMMNGIKATGDTEAVEFDELGEQDAESRPVDSATGTAGKKSSDRKSRGRRATTETSKSSDQTPSQTTPVHETPLERKRREAEEYRKKRDADPAFVPNRGAFFMHDHRSESAGGNGFRPFGRGRGRNGFNSFASSPDSGGAWKHDMHDEIVAAEKEREKQRAQRQGEQRPAPQGPQALQAATTAQQQPQASSLHKSLNNNNNHPPNRFFDTTINKGNVQIRVSLPGMKEPRVFDDFAVKIYTKLPYHRPPLRRDKPVRISLPESLPRYIYPAISRSFVFIPRAMRPGGSGFTRGGIVGGGLGPTPRRGSLAGSYRGGMQTGSVYGGTSTHAPSVAMSRRSSIHQDFSRPPISFGNIPAVTTGGPSPSISMRPVVRLPVVPPASTQMDSVPAHTDGFVPMPATAAADGASHPLPHETVIVESGTQNFEQKEAQQGSHVPLPMHQPKPQKTVSVENIETPVTYNFANTNYPTPGPYSDGIPTPGYYNQQHNRVPSYPSQTSTTPHIPDQAVHARPFQPTYPQPGYYYPVPPHAMYPPPPMHAQPPMPHQPQGPPPPYVPSPAAMPYVPQGQMPGPPMGPPGPPMGTIAQESNGTVYYYDSTQLYPGAYPGGYMPPVAMVPPNSAPPGESQVPGAIHANGMYYYPPMVPVPMVPQGPIYYG